MGKRKGKLVKRAPPPNPGLECSPFGTLSLDELRLIVDRIGKEDALCAALSCKDLRGLVMISTGGTIRTPLAACFTSPERLQWAVDNGAPWDARLFAARHLWALEVLQKWVALSNA